MPAKKEGTNEENSDLREEVNKCDPHRRHREELAGKIDLLHQRRVADNRSGCVAKNFREIVHENHAGEHVNDIVLYGAVHLHENAKREVEDQELGQRLRVAPQHSKDRAAIASSQFLMNDEACQVRLTENLDQSR